MYRPLLLFALLSAGTLLPAQEERKIEILNSEYMEYDASVASGVVKYVGDVAFQQQEMLLSCDSAWYFARQNNVHAYGNVHIIQGDTLNLFGDELRYFGNKKFAEMRYNVTLIDKETKLTTDYLDFDLEISSGQGHTYPLAALTSFKSAVTIYLPEQYSGLI